MRVTIIIVNKYISRFKSAKLSFEIGFIFSLLLRVDSLLSVRFVAYYRHLFIEYEPGFLPNILPGDIIL